MSFYQAIHKMVENIIGLGLGILINVVIIVFCIIGFRDINKHK